MKENKKKIVIFISIILILLVFLAICFITDSMYKNDNLIKTKESLITKQYLLEKNFNTSGYTIENPNIILDPYDNSPLSALILFETDIKVSPKVIIEGKDKLSTYTHEFEKEKEHYLPIYGLYPNKENKIIIKYDENGKSIKKEITIKTSELPKDFILPTSVKKEELKLSNDLYFFTPSSKGYTCAYDVNGDVRWYLKNYALWDNTRLKNGHILISTERRVNTPYYMSGLYEIDMLGKIYKEYSLEGGYHHDYFEMENSNLLVASDDFENEYGTVEDYIVELDRKTGKVVKTFDLKNILDMKDTGNENYTSYDWFHNNSVWYDKKTNSITLSGRHQDAIINIDYETSKINWIIGDSTNWSEKYKKYFFKPIGDDFEFQWSQHAAMITPEGYVFVFDNGNNKSKDKSKYVKAENSYSRGVMYKIDTKNMTIKQIWQYGKDLGGSFYSPYISDVDYISKDHYIVHSGGIVYVNGKNSNQPAGFTNNAKLKSETIELLNDKVIFDMVLLTNNYRIEKMSLYSKDVYSPVKGEKLGTLGETQVDSIRYIPFSKINKIDNEYKKHNISFVKEEDRLVFTGQFVKDDEVNIVLYKNLTFKKYHVKISKHPYTALCVDVFTDEENENGIVVNKYINSDGLNGKYSLYLEINDKLYDTEKVVNF